MGEQARVLSPEETGKREVKENDDEGAEVNKQEVKERKEEEDREKK